MGITLTELVRIILAAICLVSVVILSVRFLRRHSKWNTKTRDYWWAMMFWSLSGAFVSIDGLFRHTEFGTLTVLIAIAACMSLLGLTRRGPWGDAE